MHPQKLTMRDSGRSIGTIDGVSVRFEQRVRVKEHVHWPVSPDPSVAELACPPIETARGGERSAVRVKSGQMKSLTRNGHVGDGDGEALARRAVDIIEATVAVERERIEAVAVGSSGRETSRSGGEEIDLVEVGRLGAVCYRKVG